MNCEFLGREQELGQIQSDIRSSRGGLLLVVGRPHVGKRQFLRQLWRRLGEQGMHALVPTTEDAEFLRVDPSTTIESFKHAVAEDPVAHGANVSGTRVIGIYGYQPCSAFADWFTTRYLRHLRGPDALTVPSVLGSCGEEKESGVMPTTLVVAAFERDVQDLQPFIVAEPIALRPLPVEVVREHLTARTKGISPPLTPKELDAYAKLVRDDAGELRPLLQILDLHQFGRTR